MNEFYALLVSFKDPRAPQRKKRLLPCRLDPIQLLKDVEWLQRGPAQSVTPSKADGHWRSLKASKHTHTHAHPRSLFPGCHGFWGMSLGKLKHISGNSSLPGSDAVCVFPLICVCVSRQAGKEGKYAAACNLRVRFHISHERKRRGSYLFSNNTCFHSHINFPQMSTNEVWMMYVYKSVGTMRHKRSSAQSIRANIPTFPLY